MKASVGDHIVLQGLRIDEPDRRGAITEVLGDEGAPPYVVRWPDGHESLFLGSKHAFVDPIHRRPSGPGRSVLGGRRGRRRALRASVGDHLILQGLGIGERDRRGEIVEVLGEAGAWPYLVRWSDGHESLFVDKTDAFVEHAVHSRHLGGLRSAGHDDVGAAALAVNSCYVHTADVILEAWGRSDATRLERGGCRTRRTS